MGTIRPSLIGTAAERSYPVVGHAHELSGHSQARTLSARNAPAAASTWDCALAHAASRAANWSRLWDLCGSLLRAASTSTGLARSSDRRPMPLVYLVIHRS